MLYNIICCTACSYRARAQYLTFHWDLPEQWATGLFTADAIRSLCFVSAAAPAAVTTRALPKKSPYIFHPLIDTGRRRRLRRTTVHCCQHDGHRRIFHRWPTPMAPTNGFTQFYRARLCTHRIVIKPIEIPCFELVVYNTVYVR